MSGFVRNNMMCDHILFFNEMAANIIIGARRFFWQKWRDIGSEHMHMLHSNCIAPAEMQTISKMSFFLKKKIYILE